jgi:hypothetical protein
MEKGNAGSSLDGEIGYIFFPPRASALLKKCGLRLRISYDAMRQGRSTLFLKITNDQKGKI